MTSSASTQDTLTAETKKLHGLLQDPHPGLFMWQKYFWEQAELVKNLLIDLFEPKPEKEQEVIKNERLEKEQSNIKYFYECGGCDCYHPLGWTGDCRDDAQRYNFDDEDNMVNPFGEGVRLYLYEIVEEDFQAAQ